VMLFITLLIHLPFPISNFSCFHIILLAKTRIIKQKQMSNMGCNQTSLQFCLLSTELPCNKKHFHALCSSAWTPTDSSFQHRVITVISC
jgi:hypothetical protein